MKIDVSLIFQVVIEFWNKHFSNKHIKNLNFKKYYAGLKFYGPRKTHTISQISKLAVDFNLRKEVPRQLVSPK